MQNLEDNMDLDTINTKLDEIINVLQEYSQSSLIFIGTFNNTSSIDIRSYYSNYSDLLVDNIIVVINKMQFRTDVNQGLQIATFTKNYNPETGIITIPNPNVHSDVLSVSVYINPNS